MTATRFLALVLPFAGAAAAAEKPLTFDVASVKPATIPSGVIVDAHGVSASRREDLERVRRTGGPGTSDPGRIHYPLVSLKGLLDQAWEGSYSEIRGPMARTRLRCRTERLQTRRSLLRTFSAPCNRSLGSNWSPEKCPWK
jgi:hypothetical protein